MATFNRILYIFAIRISNENYIEKVKARYSNENPPTHYIFTTDEILAMLNDDKIHVMTLANDGSHADVIRGSHNGKPHITTKRNETDEDNLLKLERF